VRELKRNELAPVMLERIIAMSTNKGEIVIDPFGGSGTTFYAAEKLERKWLGIELGELDSAIARLKDYHEGRVEEWESARGNQKNKRKKTVQSEFPFSSQEKKT